MATSNDLPSSRGPSVIVESEYAWRDRAWRGLPWHTAVIHKAHVGTFTPAGTFAAAAAKIPYLADLGITALQLVPMRDGALPYAPHASHGRPEDLKALVDKAHSHGLMVFLDVVAASNETAPYWLEEFHLDGLRLENKEADLSLLLHEPGKYAGHFAGLPPTEFIAVLRNRDRISQQALRAASAIQWLLPQIPLLFMGDEWESTAPFEASRPTKLDWSELRQPDGLAAHDRCQRSLSIRRNEIVPRLAAMTRGGRAEMLGEHSFRIEWVVGDSELLVLEANLSEKVGHVTRLVSRGVLWVEGEFAPGSALPPWGVIWYIKNVRA